MNQKSPNRVEATRSRAEHNEQNKDTMKISKLSVMALIAVGSMVAFSPLAIGADAEPTPGQGQRGQGRRGGGTPEEQIKLMADDLKLTSEQQEKVKPLLKDRAEKMAALRADTALSQEDRRTKNQELRTAFSAKMKTVLTTEQFDKWEKSQQGQRRGQGGQGGQGGQRRQQTN